jgi:PqqD family protein of HPr-rel-A system
MLTLSRSVVSTETDYGTALLDQRSGRYWTLNPTATVILRVLLDGGDRSRAVHALLDQFDVEPDTARADVDLLIIQLRSAGLVTAHAPAVEPGAAQPVTSQPVPGEPGTGEPGIGEPGISEPPTGQTGPDQRPPAAPLHRSRRSRGGGLPFRRRPAGASGGRHSARGGGAQAGRRADDQAPSDRHEDRLEGGR